MPNLLRRRGTFGASRAAIFTVAAVFSSLVLIGDRSRGQIQVLAQAAAWTAITLGLLLSTLWPFLRGRTERVLLLVLVLIHVALLYNCWAAFPFARTFSVIVYAAIEVVLFGVTFVKMSQWVNATSPFREGWVALDHIAVGPTTI